MGMTDTTNPSATLRRMTKDMLTLGIIVPSIRDTFDKVDEDQAAEALRLAFYKVNRNITPDLASSIRTFCRLAAESYFG
jgi:ACT domain-containing protein